MRSHLIFLVKDNITMEFSLLICSTSPIFVGIQIPNQSNPKLKSQIPLFYRDPFLADQHISHFVDHISDLNIVHEDIGMRMFAMSLMGEVKDWFILLGKGEISSFTDFSQGFLNQWVPIHNQ
jgi:hypothetical protein